MNTLSSGQWLVFNLSYGGMCRIQNNEYCIKLNKYTLFEVWYYNNAFIQLFVKCVWLLLYDFCQCVFFVIYQNWFIKLFKQTLKMDFKNHLAHRFCYRCYSGQFTLEQNTIPLEDPIVIDYSQQKPSNYALKWGIRTWKTNESCLRMWTWHFWSYHSSIFCNCIWKLKYKCLILMLSRLQVTTDKLRNISFATSEHLPHTGRFINKY